MVDWSVTFDVAFDIDPADEPGGGDWTDLTDRLAVPVEISSGSGRLSGGAEGSADLLLDNVDRAIDPTNTSATYNLVPMRHARLRATIGVTTYPLFRGFVDAWPPTWSNYLSYVNVRLVDGFAWLGLQDADLDLPRQMSHVRITAILDAAGWPAGLRDIGDGVVELEPFEQTGANLLQSLRDAAAAESGELYCAPDGKITFRSRHNRFNATPDVTFGVGGVRCHPGNPVWDTAKLTNIARLELEDGSIYEFIDDASVDDFGPRTTTVRDMALRAAEATAVAQWEIFRFAETRLWVNGLLIDSVDPGALAAALGLRIGDLAAVVHDPPAGATVDVELNIERVNYSIGATRWHVAFDLSPYFGAGFVATWDDGVSDWWDNTDAQWAP